MWSKQTDQFDLSFNWSALTVNMFMWVWAKSSPTSMVRGQLALYLHHKQGFRYCSYVWHMMKGHICCPYRSTHPLSCVAACSLLLHGMYRCLDVMATINVLPWLFSVNRPFRMSHVDVTHFKPWGKNRILLTNCLDVFVLFACVMLVHNSLHSQAMGSFRQPVLVKWIPEKACFK